MRQRMCRIVAALLLLAILPAALLGAGASLPACYQDSYYAQLPALYRRLADSQGERLILLGGSNVAFGVDVGLLEHMLAQYGYEYTVCPFGLYAAVGTSAMLELSQGQLREGDIVVLAVEPTGETLSTYFGASAFWKCAEEAPELLAAVSPAHQAALAGNYVGFLQERASIWRSGDFPTPGGAYAKSSFEENGNMSFYRAGNIMSLGWDTGAPVDLAAVSVSPDFAQQVNGYCRNARKQGAQVYLSFSPVNRSALTGDPETGAAAYFRACLDAFSCPIISDPNRYILDSGWFYDSNFHLNSAGAVLRTCLLAEDLLAQLGCYEELSFPRPTIPDPVPQETEEAPDSGWFLFSPVDEAGSGYLVSGLTEAGLAQASLTVPSSFEGRPVVGLGPHALDGAEHLGELRLPEAVESLPDRAFEGCPGLTRLVLEHTQRLCRITEDTFGGAPQVKIYVPAAAYSLYRDGDGCENNLWSALLDRIFPY